MITKSAEMEARAVDQVVELMALAAGRFEAYMSQADAGDE